MTEKPSYKELEHRVKELEKEITELKRIEVEPERQDSQQLRLLKDAENITFEEMFNIDDIQSLQDDFAKATNVASIITHTNGKPITAPSNFCRLCKDIIRKTDKGLANCFKSDAVIGRFHPNGPIIQKCMSGGLWDAGAGISVGERHIANWLIGQVRDDTQNEEKMLEYANKIGAKETDFIDAFREVPTMPREQFKRIAKALFRIANQISTIAYHNIQQTRFIAERNYAEKSLHKSEAKYRLLADNITDNIWVLDIVTLKFTYVSPSIIGITGYSADEVMGFQLQDVLTPTSFGLATNLLNTELSGENQSAGPSRSHTLELEQYHKDGTTIWTEASVRFIHNKERQPVSMLGVTRNITERKQAEQSLRESEDRLTQIVMRSPVPTFVIDHNHITTHWNKALENVSGILKDDVVGTNDQWKAFYSAKRPVLADLIVDGIPKDELQKFYSGIYRKSASIEEAYEAENYFPDMGKDGRWLFFTAAPLIDRSGETIGAVETLQDTTVRKNAEQELKDSEEKYRRIFENSVVGFFQSTPEGRFLNVNAAFARMLKYDSPKDLIVSVTDIATQHYVEPIDRQHYQQILQDEGKIDGFEFRVRCKDGSQIWVSNSTRACFDKDGLVITHYEGVISEITNRKKVEGALKKSDERLKLALDSVSDAVWDWRVDIDEIYFSSSWYSMLGYKPYELPQSFETWRNLLHPDDVSNAKQTITQHLESGKPFKVEFRMRTKDGQWKWILSRGRTVEKDENGIALRMLGTHMDITERKEIEKHIQQTQTIEAIGNLAGGIAHDFNNLLFPIIGMSEMLLMDLPPDTLEHENAQVILDAAQRGGELVKQILAFSHQAEHKKLPVRIQHILKEVLRLSRATIPSDIEITRDIQNNCGLVMADPTQIHQIAMNLITNAYHAVEQTGGTIFVQLTETTLEPDDLTGRSLSEGRYAKLTISDTGHGIESNVTDKIFDPYFTTKEQGKGTGLGLAVVYGIVTEHDGDITVNSEVGEGTSFSVCLPLLEKKTESIQIEPIESEKIGNEKILVVDDEESIVKIEKQILERLGYRVTSRLHSLEALEAFKANASNFDLVITDMNMPHLTGAQFAEQLLSIRPDIPIVLCTGFSERINKEKADNIGIKGFLMKPIVRSDMARMVRKVLDEAKGNVQG